MQQRYLLQILLLAQHVSRTSSVSTKLPNRGSLGARNWLLVLNRFTSTLSIHLYGISA